MTDLIEKVKGFSAAFERRDIAAILNSLAEDASWEFEAAAEISWSGIRRGPAGFFAGIGASRASAASSH